jgi:hypothetical protein
MPKLRSIQGMRDCPILPHCPPQSVCCQCITPTWLTTFRSFRIEAVNLSTSSLTGMQNAPNFCESQ